MGRVAILGNAAGGTSTLARRLAAARGLPLVERDRLLWQPGWRLVPAETDEAAHAAAIAGAAWVIEGLGRRESIPARLARATETLLIDLPLPEHERLVRQRHDAWAAGGLTHPPGGLDAPPPLHAMLDTVRRVARDWMPEIRDAVGAAERRGCAVRRITGFADLDPIL